jgi:hypothetical protein
MLSLTIFGATVAYTTLNLYLLAKIMPVPITLLPQTAEHPPTARARASA